MLLRTVSLTAVLSLALIAVIPSAAAQSMPVSPAADTAPVDGYVEISWYATQPVTISASCVRKFRRMKVAKVEVAIVLELDSAGAVSVARFATASTDDKFNQCMLDWAKGLTFNADSPRLGVITQSIVNASLTPPPPDYRQYAGGDAATIQNWGSPMTLCKLTGRPGSNRDSACSAYVLLVDGQVAKWYARNNRIAPGARTLSLACYIQTHHAGAWPVPTLQSQIHVFDLEAGGSYRLEPRWDGGTCVVDLIDTSSGQPVEKTLPGHTPPTNRDTHNSQ